VRVEIAGIEQAFTRKSDPVFLLRSDPALAREELSFRTSQISSASRPHLKVGVRRVPFNFRNFRPPMGFWTANKKRSQELGARPK